MGGIPSFVAEVLVPARSRPMMLRGPASDPGVAEPAHL